MRHEQINQAITPPPIAAAGCRAALMLCALITVILLVGTLRPAIAAELPDATTFAIRVEQGDISTVSEWLDAGLDPNFEGDRRGTGLMIAAWEGNIPMMSLFVKHGADVNRTNLFKEQALMHAAWRGHLPAASWLIDRGAQIDSDENEWGALHYAAFAGHDLIAKFLIQKGADLNARSNNGATPLMMAAHEGKEAVARILLHAGADPRVKNYAGEDALTWAMRYEHPGIGRLVSAPEEFAQAAAQPKESWGDAVSPIPAPPEVEKIIQDLRVARANGSTRVLSAVEYRKIMDSVSKMQPATARSKQPKSMRITSQKRDPRKEKAEFMFGK